MKITPPAVFAARKKVIVSFEEEAVRVVYASGSAAGVEVQDTLVMKDEQFDGFLEKERTRDFTVVMNFKEFYQETYRIPAVSRKFLRSVIESEINRKSGLKDYSYIYSLSEEFTTENKSVRDVFVYAVKNDSLRNVAERFAMKGKRLSAIYPDIFALGLTAGQAGGVGMCVYESGMNKNIALVKNGRVWFTRIVESDEHGLGPFDVQSIEMTLNYCRQTFRTNPEYIMLLGGIGKSLGPDTALPLPVACFSPPSTKAIPGDLATEFIVPLSACFAGSAINILPTEVKSLNLKGALLKYSTMALLACSFMGILYSGYQSVDIYAQRKQMAYVRDGMPVSAAINIAYNDKASELEAYRPFMESFARADSQPDFQGLLYGFSALDTEGVVISSIDLRAKGKVVRAKLSGSVASGDYARTEKRYSGFVASFARLEDISVGTGDIGLKDRNFSVEIEKR